ncbi:MAG: hypothetical protein ABIJ16_10525, partial [Bacteroidota bacterium]
MINNLIRQPVKMITVLALLFTVTVKGQHFVVDSLFVFPEYSEGKMFEIMNDTLVIAGGFEKVGPDSILVNHIARWDGHQFYAMGDGNTNWENVFCSITYNGFEYYGGGFHSMGYVPQTYSIAGWNGNQFFSIGNCTSSQTFYDMTVWHDTLFIVGDQGSINGYQYWGIA